MQLVEIVKKRTQLTTYRISQILKERFNVSVSRAQLDYYKNNHSMRLDVMSALRKLSGLSWNQWGKLIDKEYGEE